MYKNNFLLFMDETGTLGNDVNQPYFGLGALKLRKTSEIMKKYYQIRKKKREVKFSKIRSHTDFSHIKKIIDFCFEQQGFNFYAFFYKKSKTSKKNTWDLQLEFAKTHIKEKCSNLPEEKVCVLADYLSKPKDAISFEEALMGMDNVFNACMLDSETTIFVQIVDILLGAISYRFRGKTGSFYKERVCQYIEEKLGEKIGIEKKYPYNGRLNENFVIQNDKLGFYFSVYEKH